MADQRWSRRELLSIGGAAAATAALGPTLLSTAAYARSDLVDSGLPQIPRRVLGKTGQTVPILLLGGAVSLDPRFDPKLAEALRYGLNYIDAADCYGGGTCESAVAAFHTRAKVRKRIWITSKSDKHDPKGFEATLNQSLRRLKTDFIDMYFLHALVNADYLNADLNKVVERAKAAGKIRYFGFSCHNHNVAALLHVAAKTPWVDAVMFRCNFRRYGDKELNKAMDAAHAAGVGLIAMKTQGSETSFADAWRKFERTGKWNKHQAVLKAVWADDRISAAVSHMDNLKKLKENIAAALDETELGAVDRETLLRYADATRAYACDGCDHLCGPAVDAPVRIGDTMRYLMYHDVYREKDKAKELFAQLPAEAQRLEGVDFSGANGACPHGIDVAAHLSRAAHVFRMKPPSLK